MLRSLLDRILAWFKPAKRPKKNQWVTVSISILLAVILWLLVTLNTQTYTTTFEVPVRLTSFPENYQLNDPFPERIVVLTRGPGIKLLYQQFEKEDTLVIDYRNFRSKDHFITDENLALIETVLQPGLEAVIAQPDSIPLTYSLKTNKRVPIIVDVKLNMPPSYRNLGGLKPHIDSVLVIGPEDSLKHIDSWKTVRFESELISSAQNLFVPLDTLKPFKTKVGHVLIPVNPVPFTEHTISVPVAKDGVPRRTRLELEKDSVRVRFLVPIAEFEGLDHQDFRASVDFAAIDERSPYLVPDISVRSEHVELIDTEPRRIKYMIIAPE